MTNTTRFIAEQKKNYCSQVIGPNVNTSLTCYTCNILKNNDVLQVKKQDYNQNKDSGMWFFRFIFSKQQ